MLRTTEKVDSGTTTCEKKMGQAQKVPIWAAACITPVSWMVDLDQVLIDLVNHGTIFNWF